MHFSPYYCPKILIIAILLLICLVSWYKLMNLFHSTIYESSSSSLISSLRTFSSISLTKNSLNIFHFSCYFTSCNSQFSDSFRNPKSVFAKEYLAILRNVSKDAINWFSDQHNFVNSYKSCGLYMRHTFDIVEV